MIPKRAKPFSVRCRPCRVLAPQMRCRHAFQRAPRTGAVVPPGRCPEASREWVVTPPAGAAPAPPTAYLRMAAPRGRGGVRIGAVWEGGDKFGDGSGPRVHRPQHGIGEPIVPERLSAFCPPIAPRRSNSRASCSGSSASDSVNASGRPISKQSTCLKWAPTFPLCAVLWSAHRSCWCARP